MISAVLTKPTSRVAKSERLVARVSREDKLVITRAAELVGASVTDFVIGEAKAAAKRLVEEDRMIRLNAKESRRLMNALLAPARKPPASVVRAKRRYQKSVASDLDGR